MSNTPITRTATATATPKRTFTVGVPRPVAVTVLAARGPLAVGWVVRVTLTTTASRGPAGITRTFRVNLTAVASGLVRFPARLLRTRGLNRLNIFSDD